MNVSPVRSHAFVVLNAREGDQIPGDWMNPTPDEFFLIFNKNSNNKSKADIVNFVEKGGHILSN